MPGADELPQVSADLLRRVHDLEEGRRQNMASSLEAKALAQSAGERVVRMVEDIHDIKSDIRELKEMVREAADSAREAARQGKITNGRVTTMEGQIDGFQRYKAQHTAEMKPIIERAEQGFQELDRLKRWSDQIDSAARDRSLIKRFIHGTVQNGWRTLLAIVGGAALASEAWDKFQ